MSNRARRLTKKERRGAGQPRALVFKSGAYRELAFADALKVMGGDISPGLRAILGADSTVMLVETDGKEELPPEFEAATENAPEAHRHLLASAGFAFYETYSTRHPALVFDAGEQHAVFIAPADRMEAFLSKKYRQPFDLETLHPDPMVRWVVSVATDGTVRKGGLGLGPKPGIARA